MKALSLALLPALALAACAQPQSSPATLSSSPVAAQAGASPAALSACRGEAERVVRYRDRGQLMRQDDYNARVGTSSYLGPQVMSDQFAQVHDRDRIIAECLRGSRGGPNAAPASPAGVPPAR